MLLCPVCSHILYFSHEAINLQACSCGTSVLRRNGELVVSHFYILQKPVSCIQPGTEGAWEGQRFKVTGRIRAWIEEFVFSYWTIVFDDNSIGYLGEGYGLYAVYKPVTFDTVPNFGVLKGMKVGAQRDLVKGSSFLLERKYSCYKCELEGEAWLPFAASTFQTFEFASSAGRRIEMLASSDDQMFGFDVNYTSFATLALMNTRPYVPAPETVSCPKCRQSNVVQTFPYAQSFACANCEAIYALQHGADFAKESISSKLELQPNIKIGSTGLLRGVSYTVVGFLVKMELNVARSRWNEYTLFNPQEGYVFLSEYNGHWVFARERGDAPVLETQTSDEFEFGQEPFRLFNRYCFEVVKALGEFPYNVFNDEHKDVREYISPPEVWIQEHSLKEGIIWYLGEHLDRKELSKAFDGVFLPYQTGVGAIEPKGFVAPAKIGFVTLVATVILLFAHLLTVSGKQERVIFDQTIKLSDSTNTSQFTTGKFELEKRSGNLEVSVHSPVDNSWFELSASLVNVVSGAEYSQYAAIEYYHGYEEGSSWTEGSQSEKTYFNRIPRGTYYLQLDGTKGATYTNGFSNGDPKYFSVRVTYDVPNHRNLLFCLGALVLWGFLHYQLVQYNEKRRWDGSPFSPFNSDDDD